MVKVGILTFHFVNNCGAILQCIALQRLLSQLPDVEVEIINYQPDYHTNVYRPIMNPFQQAWAPAKSFQDRNLAYRFYRYIRNVASSLEKSRHFIERYKRREIFRDYYQKNMRLSKIYKTLTELSDCEKYDLYIVGSDQLWNSHITNYSIDRAYYLEFVNCGIGRKISYAVSANLQENEIPEVSQLLKKFDLISVREERTFRQLINIVEEKNIRIDLDPTMLLAREDYLALEEEILIPEKYILFYGLATKDRIPLERALGELVSHTHLEVFDISPVSHNLKTNSVKKKLYSPGQFLTVIKNAEYIVTNSFHGTVFSIIYNKNFFTALPSLHPERLEYLLATLELNDRIIKPGLQYSPMIEWDTTNRLLEKARRESKSYLFGEVEKARKEGNGD